MYEMLHWLHHIKGPRFLAKIPIYKQLRHWHHQHHMEPDCHFALVFPLWDFLFWTHVSLGSEEPETKEEEVAEAPPRKRPTTSIQALIEDTLQQAAEASGDDVPKPATRRGGRGTTSRTGRSRRSKDTGRTRSSQKTGSSSPSWMNALDRAMEDDADVTVSAVKDDTDD